MNPKKAIIPLSLLLLFGIGLILTKAPAALAQKIETENHSHTSFATRTVYMLGDDSRWANKDLDEENWNDIAESGLPNEKRIYWIRNHFNLSNSETAASYDHAIGVGILGAYEVYWDGELIGRSGKVGNSKTTETPGKIQDTFRIPPALFRPGEHIVSMRVSNFYSQKDLRSRHFHIFSGSHEAYLKRGYEVNILPLMMQGGIIIIGLYYLIMFGFYQRKPPVLIFSLLCFTMALLIYAESYKDLFNYAYPWHWYRMILVLLLSGVISLLLIAFCLHRFEFTRKYPTLISASAIMLIIGTTDLGFDMRTYIVFAVGLISALFIVGYAHKEGSSLTMIGLLITALIMLVLPSQFMERYLFLSFGILALFILGSLTLSLRKQQHEHEAALLNSSRLEIELLKKNIQPHFILNTLTAVEEWIEESPKTAIQFIDSLANEFRIMSTMASKKLVPLKQELALCHSHLEIMSYRKGIKFELKIDIENHVDIPPACIHTLIENAISHNPYREGTIQFELKQIIDKTNINFIFKAPRYAKKQDTQAHSATIGTGLKYIQARLEESFSGKWKFTEEHDDNFWTTTISLPLERR